MEKIKTLIWFLKRPYLYKQLFYQARQSLFPHPKERTREESTKWCKNHALDTWEALKAVTGKSELEKVENIAKKDFDNAYSIEKNLPVKMGGGGDYNLLYHLTCHFNAKISVETGVAHGWSTLSILLGQETIGNGILYSTDMPYAKMGNEAFVGCVIPERLRKNWKLYRKPDRQGLREIFKTIDQIDMCHYDSDKSYRGRMWAYPLFWSKIKAGGVFISDDINDNIAFKEFSEKVGINPIIVKWNQQYIGILIKP